MMANFGRTITEFIRSVSFLKKIDRKVAFLLKVYLKKSSSQNFNRSVFSDEKKRSDRINSVIVRSK